MIVTVSHIQVFAIYKLAVSWAFLFKKQYQSECVFPANLDEGKQHSDVVMGISYITYFESGVFPYDVTAWYNGTELLHKHILEPSI